MEGLGALLVGLVFGGYYITRLLIVGARRNREEAWRAAMSRATREREASAAGAPRRVTGPSRVIKTGTR